MRDLEMILWRNTGNYEMLFTVKELMDVTKEDFRSLPNVPELMKWKHHLEAKYNKQLVRKKILLVNEFYRQCGSVSPFDAARASDTKLEMLREINKLIDYEKKMFQDGKGDIYLECCIIYELALEFNMNAEELSDLTWDTLLDLSMPMTLKRDIYLFRIFKNDDCDYVFCDEFGARYDSDDIKEVVQICRPKSFVSFNDVVEFTNNVIAE